MDQTAHEMFDVVLTLESRVIKSRISMLGLHRPLVGCWYVVNWQHPRRKSIWSAIYITWLCVRQRRDGHRKWGPQVDIVQLQGV